MDNKKMLNDILKIRDIRNNLINLNLQNNEKEVLRKSLNYYEDLLNLDITRNNLNATEFIEQGIPSDIEVVDIPIEENTTRYIEITKLNDNELISTIDTLSSSISNLELDNNDVIVILKSLKEYSEYLKELSLKKQKNNEIYNEIINENNEVSYSQK